MNGPPTRIDGRQRIVLPATLVVTMTAGVFQLYLFSVLAAPIIDDLGISRTQIGIVGAVNTAVGALSAPWLGRLTDRLGAGRSIVASLTLSSAGMATLAVAPGWGGMLAASAVGGFPQGWSNPATNGVISARVAAGSRGTLTGIKQSGVTFGIFASGITLPVLEQAVGWRGASWVYAGVFAGAAVAVRLLLDPDPPRFAPPADSGRPGRSARLDPIVWWIAPYAFFMGLSAGTVGRFTPLFAEESLGFSTASAGLVVALSGLLGVVARVYAARLAEHRIAPTRLLVGLSGVGCAFGLMLASLTPAIAWLLWATPVLNAVGTNAWNAVAMMAIIMFVSTADAGRASGVVMFGFLGGLAVSGPLAGMAIDASGSYRAVWLATAVTSGIAGVIMWFTDRHARPSGAPQARGETPAR